MTQIQPTGLGMLTSAVALTLLPALIYLFGLFHSITRLRKTDLAAALHLGIGCLLLAVKELSFAGVTWFGSALRGGPGFSLSWQIWSVASSIAGIVGLFLIMRSIVLLTSHRN